jgi:hypothetical protein
VGRKKHILERELICLAVHLHNISGCYEKICRIVSYFFRRLVNKVYKPLQVEVIMQLTLMNKSVQQKQMFQELSKFQIQMAVLIYTAAAACLHRSVLALAAVRPSVSPCARWCRRRPRSAPTRSGSSLRCCIPPRTQPPSSVSLIAAMGSCL